MLIAFMVCCGFATATFGQQFDVLKAAQCTNDYFMQKYADPTIPTNVKKVRPSSLWTRAVYYEGLMALQAIDPQQRYIDYGRPVLRTDIRRAGAIYGQGLQDAAG